MEKNYTKKDGLKILIIICIIAIPLVIAYGAAGYFEENGTKFWSDWDCDEMTTFSQSSEFSRITAEQRNQFDETFSLCLDEP